MKFDVLNFIDQLKKQGELIGASHYDRRWGSQMAGKDQQETIIKLLKTAQMLVDDLQEGVLSNLIERAIDHAKHEMFPRNVKQAPYWRG
jgi:hypothetical protein